MENFIVSARKYRPNTFDRVVGQAAITTTLKNAIKNNHLAQAFLFTGPRGVGKTTCARLLAKTINCSNPTSVVEACNECESCQSFDNNASYNIYELDAASNNGVDHIKSLIEQVRIPPQIGRYKVYIIDEVHMLSSSAFNAFLKTLEEPPAYAKFILATTEKHKILPTILSRCQIYDFKRITIDDIVKHLKYVADTEEVSVDNDALHIIAQKADGALRDSLSIFDQLVSFAGNTLTYHNVIENLNVLDHDYYFKIVDLILNGDISNSLMVLNDIIDNGFDGNHFITGLGSHLRNLLMCRDAKTIVLIETSDNIRQLYLTQAAHCDLNFLIRGLDIVNSCDISYKNSNNKRLHIELALLKMCKAQDIQNQASPSSTELPKSTPKTPVIQNPVPPTITVPVQKKEVPAPPPPVTTAPPIPAPTQTTIISEPECISFIPKTNLGIKQASTSNSQTTKDDESSDETEILAHSFSTLDFEKKWAEFAESVQNDNKLLYTALTNSPPQIDNNYTIQLDVINTVMESEVNEYRADILQYVRSGLKNHGINLEIEIKNNGNSANRPYNPSEKWSKMMETNSLVAEFRTRFDLEIDY
ncbi:MAG: DNA polymerase III subunit gamma/tau [Bacteroidales bacterium]|jgi:DNA polymerase-3 subunit gamma/tau|nr:DNA polymerase III subunit gamma/tau [Bacteroidales bacterium]